MTQLWTEKYRPKILDEYVFVDDRQEEVVRGWVEQKYIPHLLLSGDPGTGKTTLAKVLFNELGAQPGDVLEINASMMGVDEVKDRIVKYAQTMPLGDFKYVLLDELDYSSGGRQNSQTILRNLMEKYSEFVRFVLTCNYEGKIIDAIKSRCEHFHITGLNKDRFQERVVEILLAEDIEIPDVDVLESYIETTYPDLRSCIKLLQSNCVGGVIKDPTEALNTDKDFIIMSVAMFKEGKFEDARKLLTSKARKNDYPDIYRMLYRNLDWWSDDIETQKQLILKIAEGVRWNDNCADPEINLSATLIEMELLT